jgi:molybdopterin/thiamine biosynthesis adenylyltransferase
MDHYDARYSRQTALFGSEGQRRLGATRVAVAGLGGTGSHVAQQLAYLGVLDFLLVDPDSVEHSNLNRLVGAVEADVGAAKTRIASRLVRAVQPDATIVTFETGIEAVPDSAIHAADVLFACVDSDAARLEIVQRCSVASLPHFDLATDTGVDWFGGRVLFSGAGERCVSCMDLLDQAALRRAAMTAGQRREDERIYGVSVNALGESGPAVVSVNGVVASLAITEFLKWRTGFQEPVELVTYRGERGVVTRSLDPPRPDCFYCASWNEG